MWSTRSHPMAEFMAFAASLSQQLHAFVQETQLCIHPTAAFVSCERHPEHFVPKDALDRHLVLSSSSSCAQTLTLSVLITQRACHKEKHSRYQSHEVKSVVHALAP